MKTYYGNKTTNIVRPRKVSKELIEISDQELISKLNDLIWELKDVTNEITNRSLFNEYEKLTKIK